jgi:hypothetical protein
MDYADGTKRPTDGANLVRGKPRSPGAGYDRGAARAPVPLSQGWPGCASLPGVGLEPPSGDDGQAEAKSASAPRLALRREVH